MANSPSGPLGGWAGDNWQPLLLVVAASLRTSLTLSMRYKQHSRNASCCNPNRVGLATRTSCWHRSSRRVVSVHLSVRHCQHHETKKISLRVSVADSERVTHTLSCVDFSFSLERGGNRRRAAVRGRSSQTSNDNHNVGRHRSHRRKPWYIAAAAAVAIHNGRLRRL